MGNAGHGAAAVETSVQQAIPTAERRYAGSRRDPPATP